MPLGHRSARRRGMLMGAAIASPRNKKSAPAPAQTPTSATNTPVESTDTASEIKKFADLRDQGLITEEEFTAKKRQILGI